jgi:glutamate-1-semialdehyde 2,1-aminomutase
VSTSAGIPESFIKETIVLPLHQPEALEKILKKHAADIACVIIEPVPCNNGLLLQEKDYLEFLREKCTEYEVLLIFDEVISGFRLGFEGAAGCYNIKPDIITYGKIIGGGLPVGAYGASKKIMSQVSPDGPVYQAGTLSGNPVAMAAGKATLTEALKEGFYKTLETNTASFLSAISTHCQEKGYKVTVQTIGSIFWISFSNEIIRSADRITAASMKHFKKFHAELLQRGVYLGPSGYEVGFVSAAHTSQELTFAAARICEALDDVFAA